MDKVLIKILVLLCLGLHEARSFITRDLRIVGGTVARLGQFPHAAGLLLHLTQNRHSFCGGSIIHPAYILTAAHCLDDVTRVEVLAGVQRIFDRNPAYREMVEPRDIRPHPQYRRDTLLNDIGLIFLIRRLPMGDNIAPISLPTRAQASNRFVGALATVIGWGRTTDQSDAISNDLRFIQLPILADQHCIDVYNSAYRYFNPTNICVSGARGSTCNGDSGGAMHLTNGGRMTIIGIVSYGTETCADGHPPVMTRVTSYLDWISANTGIALN